MTEQPTGRSATTNDANAGSVMAKKIAIVGDDRLAQATFTDDQSSVQRTATQKILAEVNLENLKRSFISQAPAIILASAAVPSAADAPAPVTAASIPAAPLEHHDASFFKHDLLHDTERVGNVLGNSFSKYFKQGVLEAGKENFETGAWVGKFETGAVLGSVLKTVLPKAGVVRALTSTVMAFNMVRDLAEPLYSGAKDAVAAKDDQDLDSASRKVSKGVGNFVVDNMIGLAAASFGEAATGAALDHFTPNFEAKKAEFWTSNKTAVGRFFNGSAETADRVTSNLSETIKPTDPETLARAAARKAVSKLPADQKVSLLQEAGEHARKHIQSAEFYKWGPEVKSAEPVEKAQTAPLGGATTDERPISLGAIRRVRADEPSAKFSTQRADEPVRGKNAEAPKAKRVGFSRFMDGLGQGKSAEEVVFPTAGTRGGAKSMRSAGDGSTQSISGPSTPEDILAKRKGPDVSPPPDVATDKTGGNAVALKRGERRGKAGPVPPDAKDSKSGGASQGDTKAGDTTPAGQKTNEADKTSGTDKTSQKPRSTSSPKDDLKHSVFAKVAQVAKAAQELWSPEQVKLADARDQFRGPINATTELDKAVLPPEYKASTAQLMGLIDQVDSAKNLKAAGMLLMYHMKAANQLLFSQDNVRDLNMLTHEMTGVFLTGMRKLGIPEDRLRRIIPSLVAETDDKGSGYFTLPPIDGVLDRPVTIVPRAFTRLISVMSPVLFHENLGHDLTYPELLRFPEADRDNLIRGAIADAMKHANIPDKIVRMNGVSMKTSEFMFKLLIAEANENTSDTMGTIAGGVGTGVSMGVLLQSLRDGGLLETRNVYGKEFEDGIEPHGIDRWRIKLCAEVMRQLAPGDKAVTEQADALDQYAKEASRSGDTYTWASVDNPGEKVEIPMAHWDAVIPYIVKAQMDTPLETLKDVKGNRHSLREMFGDGFAQKVKGIDGLADMFVDAIHDGKTDLPNFDKTKYTIGQVFTAGLVAWLRATRHDVDPVESLKEIDAISAKLRAQYREFNPNEVPLTTPGSVKLKQAFSQSPAQFIRTTGAVVADSAPSLRLGADRIAPLMGGTATGDVYGATQWLSREAREMTARTKEVLGYGAPAGPPADASDAIKVSE
jgi:hypothetical protein